MHYEELALPTPPDSNAPDTPTRKESTGEYLERLSKSFLHLSLNLRDSFNPLIMRHMAPTFRGTHDTLPKVVSREDHQSSLQKHLSTEPDLRCEIKNSSSDVDDSRGRATVYLWYELSGLTHGLEREAVAVMSWERKQGTWVHTKHTGMRGPSGFPTT